MDGELTLAGGAVLGLASAVHCACMCGGIATGLTCLMKPATARERAYVLATLHAGRVTAYAIAGAIVSLAASPLVSPLAASGSYRLLQWAAAVSLMWMGLSLAGLMPQVAGLDSRVLTLSRALDSFLAPLRRRPALGPYVLGLTWGFNPCPMVYGALFTAALTGSPGRGALFMTGFGLGTVPSVMAAAFGLSTLATLKSRRLVEVVVGLSIAGLGFASVYYSWPISSILCLTR